MTHRPRLEVKLIGCIWRLELVAVAAANALLGAVDTAHSTLAWYPQRDAVRAVGAHVLQKNITTSTFDTASGPPPGMTAP